MVFGEFSIFFIGMLFIMIVHDLITGESSNTAEYCAKYGLQVFQIVGSKITSLLN